MAEDEAARKRVEAERQKARDEDQARRNAAQKARDDQARGQQAIDDAVALATPSAPGPPSAPAATAAPPVTAPAKGAREDDHGCLVKLGIPAAITTTVLLALGILIWFFTASDSKRSSLLAGAVPSSSCANSPSGSSRGDGLVLISCDAPAGVASVAGHWELASGLDDPDGLDEGTHVGPGFTGTLSLGSRSASFDVADDGTVTGGEYDTSHTETDDTCTRTYTLTASSATGSFQPDGFGTVTWNGTQTLSASCREGTGHTAWPLQMYFFQLEGKLIACRLGPGAIIPTTTPTACAGDEAAHFSRS